MAERRFTEKQIAEILRRAAEIQAGTATGQTGGTVSESELRAAAREIGLEPSSVDRALESGESSFPPAPGFFGGPIQVEHEQAVSGVMTDDAWEDTVLDLRRTFGLEGTVTVRPEVREWSTTGGGMYSLTISVRQSGDVARVNATLNQDSACVFAYLIGMLPTIIGVGLTGSVLRSSPILAFTLSAILAGVLFFVVRTIFSAKAAKHAGAVGSAVARIAGRAAAPEEAAHTAPLLSAGDEVSVRA
jgi:hypothetical protein